MQDACAFDGSKALVVARPPKLKSGVKLPADYTDKVEFTVTGVDVPEKGTKANWKVSSEPVEPVLETTPSSMLGDDGLHWAPMYTSVLVKHLCHSPTLSLLSFCHVDAPQ